MQTDELHGNMKENQNGILFHINSPGRYADPLATEINDKDRYWNTPELECALVMDDFINVHGSEIKSRPQFRSESFGKETDFYTDKNVMECELPELMICYKESGAYHVVKDICVDEGIHSEEKNLIGNCKDDHEALPVNGDKCNDIVKGKSRTQDGLKSSSREDGGLNAANECGTQKKSDSALLMQDSRTDNNSSLPDNSDMGEKGDYTEPLIQDGHEGKGQGHNDLPILDDHEDDHSNLSERNTDTKSLLVDGPQSSMVKDSDATGEFGTKQAANIELPVSKGIQSSDDSDDIAFSGCGPALSTDQGATNNCGPRDLVQHVEDCVPAIDKLMYDASAEESDSSSMSAAKTFRQQTSLKFLLNSSEFGASDDDDEHQAQVPVAEISKTPDSSSDAEEVSSSGQASNLTFSSEVESGSIGLNLNPEKSAASSEEETEVESGSNGLNLDKGKSAVISEEETSKDDLYLPIEDGNLGNPAKANQEQFSVGESSFSVAGPIEGLPTYLGPDHGDETSDTASLARLVQRGDGESSFSVGGPVSGRIAYSGQIPFSGSISLRSDSSATSTRSFAFPVLQNEWNSSPVRMAKAERRRFHKHRGWRQGILCCRF